MGSACTTCISDTSQKKEVIQDLFDQDRTPQRTPAPSPKVGNKNSNSQKFFGNTESGEQKEDGLDAIMKLNRVKALMRGWIQRRRLRKQQVVSASTTKYFVKEEANETLGGIYEANAPLEQRTHTYKTGSVYVG